MLFQNHALTVPQNTCFGVPCEIMGPKKALFLDVKSYKNTVAAVLSQEKAGCPGFSRTLVGYAHPRRRGQIGCCIFSCLISHTSLIRRGQLNRQQEGGKEGQGQEVPGSGNGLLARTWGSGSSCWCRPLMTTLLQDISLPRHKTLPSATASPSHPLASVP